MRLLFALLVLAAPLSANAFSYATGGCATAGCAATEQWEHTNANEIDAALDALETTTASHTSTLSGLGSTYLAKAGGTMTGGLIMGAGSSIDLLSGVYMVVASGAGVEAVGTGYILATAMSATGQIDDNDLAAGAVDGGTGGEIADGSITAADLATDSVTGTDILNDTVALITDTAGDFIATVTGDAEITVSGAGTEGRAITLAVASSLTRDTELALKSAESSTISNVAKFSDTTGNLVDSLLTVADTTGNVTTPGALSVGGSTGASTFTVKNMADLVWYECGMEGSQLQCGVDGDGTPDGTIGLTTTGKTTWTVRNTADSGYVECGVVGTTMTCAVDADGTPDGTL